ncbi:hypothetical protein BGZ60DRAFT_549948 [Tricladium varicosporioides]|nr:hypothetical protein BGZ60DRAFT_549948 [Hymenoscyphus varicosporioides]
MYTSVSLLALVASVSAQGLTLTGACLNGPCATATGSTTASFITGACLNGPCGTATSSNAASSTSITAIALGQTCDPFGTPCANGAQCFNKESRRIPSCGNYMAACTSDLQCAHNLCVSGTCSGEKSYSTSTSVKSSTTSGFLTGACLNGPCTAATATGTSITGACLGGPCTAAKSTATEASITGVCLSGPCTAAKTATSAQTTPTALTGTLPVGSLCVIGSNPCADGSQCYAAKSDLQTICGNYGAGCTKDSQCAFNVCANGFCGGWKSSVIGQNTTAPTTVAPPPPGFTTSFTVIDGKTSSALVNSAGSTTAFATAAATATGGFTAGAGKVGSEVKGLVMAIALIIGAVL